MEVGGSCFHLSVNKSNHYTSKDSDASEGRAPRIASPPMHLMMQ